MKFFVALFAFATLSAQAAPIEILGNWSYKMERGPHSFRSVLQVRELESTITSECGYEDKITKVSVTVPSVATEDLFTIADSASAQATEAGVTCSIEIVPTEMMYKVEGDTLQLFNRYGHPVIYTRDTAE